MLKTCPECGSTVIIPDLEILAAYKKGYTSQPFDLKVVPV